MSLTSNTYVTKLKLRHHSFSFKMTKKYVRITPVHRGKDAHAQCGACRVGMRGPALGVGMGWGEVGILPVMLLPYSPSASVFSCSSVHGIGWNPWDKKNEYYH